MTEPLEIGPQQTKTAFRIATWLLGAILLIAVAVVVSREFLFVEHQDIRTLEDLLGQLHNGGLKVGPLEPLADSEGAERSRQSRGGRGIDRTLSLRRQETRATRAAATDSHQPANRARRQECAGAGQQCVRDDRQPRQSAAFSIGTRISRVWGFRRDPALKKS